MQKTEVLSLKLYEDHGVWRPLRGAFPLHPHIPLSSRIGSMTEMLKSYHAAIELYHSVAWIQLPTALKQE